MHIGFRIITKDGQIIESHDKSWNLIKDHSHALPPFNNSPWSSYAITTDEGTFLAVNFETGEFSLNGVRIQPGEEGGGSLTHNVEGHQFQADPPREILAELPYFPIFGRRIFKGDWGESAIYYCGWKRKFGGRTVEKIVYLYPNGAIVFV
ncbi:MAG: hypothetical protein KCHDKBKB_00781 [Elusimicrobia bacterium]|nr:hypothetical protein [Elusimicrobiota bacterium]